MMALKFILVVCALSQFANAETASTPTRLLVETVNSKKTTWKARHNFPEGTSLESFKHRLGFLGNHPDPNFQIDVKTHMVRQGIPETFDAREQWPHCASVIDNIRNQGNCGSCWAFSAAEVMSDRLCIQSAGEYKFQFSPEDLLSCCSTCGYGCGGGYTYYAWQYWQSSGIVSGGDYDSKEGCQPYEGLAYLDNITPPCKATCTNTNYTVAYEDDKHFGKSVYKLKVGDVEQIQNEIMTNGPVQVSYKVYEDFMSYSEGVYHHVVGPQLGGHAVKIIGWGTEAGTPYWLVANSWGAGWANLKGYFKIRRGNNECGIEENVLAGAATYGDLGGLGGDPGSGGMKVISSTLGLFLACLIFLYM